MAKIDDALDKLDDVLDKLGDVLDKLADNLEAINVSRSLQKYCQHCAGDGDKVIGEETGSCPDCAGDGYRKYGIITLTSEE